MIGSRSYFVIKGVGIKPKIEKGYLISTYFCKN